MGMEENLLPNIKLAELVKVDAAADAGADDLVSNHMRNWMECIRSRKETNAPVEAGYYHSIANIMTNASVRTGYKATFDEATQEVMVNGKAFKY
jgi:glucose-6-phosphate dehydrogenase assembly protein OpcA